MLSLRFYLSAFFALALGSVAEAYSTSSVGPTRGSASAAGVSQATASASVAESSRRSFFRGALSTAFGVGLVTTTFFNPSGALAAAGDEAFQKKQLMPLETYIYTISRVREATAQEMRLIKTGKFKDAARGNVKLAVRFMLNNYRLSDNVIAAASYLKGQQQIQAGSDGQVCFQCFVDLMNYSCLSIQLTAVACHVLMLATTATNPVNAYIYQCLFCCTLLKVDSHQHFLHFSCEQKAVQALYTILEYFDAGSVENIKVSQEQCM